jgi:hypothetical protein
MEEKQLLEIGFVNTSYMEDDDVIFTEFSFANEKIRIEISGIDFVEINVNSTGFIHVPNCKTFEDLKYLIKLFT